MKAIAMVESKIESETLGGKVFKGTLYRQAASDGKTESHTFQV
jgi:hypothetical protein